MPQSFTASDAARVREAASRALDEHHVAGMGLGVVSGGDLVFAEGFGFADIESGRRQAPELRQRIGSITKTMVALCAMALVDEGRLALGDRLVDLVPEVTLHGDGDTITVRHLLTHTAGIGEVPMPSDVRAMDATLWSAEPHTDALALFPDGLTIDVAPGTKWSYANFGYALLGEIVARTEGLPIAEVVRRRIFEPLAMTHSDLLDRPHPELTTGYHHAPSDDARELAARMGTPIKDEPTVDGHNIRGRYMYIRGGGAAGAVQSTVPDMALYASALLRRGAGIVRPATFDTMVAPQWCPDDRLESWGLSFQRFERFGRRIFGHGGGVLGGWNSMLLISPQDERALILHANTAFDEFAKLVSRMLAATLAASPAEVSGSVAPDALAAAPGVYEGVPGMLTNVRIIGSIGRLQVKAADGGLTLYSRRGPWKRGVRMIASDPADPYFFTLDDDPFEPGRLALRRDGGGRVTGLRCDRLVEMVRTEQVAPWA
jgi:CubicO group peptidase (beta-lactamase class C family)